MNRTDVRTYCLTKPGAWIDQPWEGDEVVKVADKIFAFLGSLDGATVGLKCGRNADEARDWREEYPEDAAVSAYIGRYGWNTLVIGGAIPDAELREAIDASYDDIVGRLPRSQRPG
jgi:predicted DNA-binding protein (MmcQ/YjbR family)